MAGVQQQVTLVKSGTRTAGQEVVDMRVIGVAPGLMNGATLPVINNQSPDFASLTAVTTAYNTLLAALRTRGVIGGA